MSFVGVVESCTVSYSPTILTFARVYLVGYADLHKLQKPWHGSAIRRLHLPQYVSELREIYLIPSPYDGQNHDSHFRSSQYSQYRFNCTNCVLS